MEKRIIITDAMGTQKYIAEIIIKKNEDYTLALKGNQGHFHKEVIEFIEYTLINGFKDIKIIKNMKKFRTAIDDNLLEEIIRNM